jgi:hypothetical protein
MDLQTAQDIGKLDPQVIAQVREDAWPEIRDAEELHDALVVHGFLTSTKRPSRNSSEALRSSAASPRAGARRRCAVCRGGAAARLHALFPECRRRSRRRPLNGRPEDACARSCAAAWNCSAR